MPAASPSPQRLLRPFRVIDSHTGGEPTRLIVAGGPDLGAGPVDRRRDVLRDRFDGYRRALCCEPRGSDVMVGGLLCPPADPAHAAGVIYFNNVGYLGMCGHGTIGLVETLRHLGRVAAGTHRVETPVGTVTAVLHEDRRVGVENVRSYRHRRAVRVGVPDLGTIVGDVAWGGNWFFLVADHGLDVRPANAARLAAAAGAIMDALAAAGVTGDDGGKIDHVELFGPPGDPTAADSRNFVLCPGGAYDRSPCGTGTSAKLACLAADGKLSPGQLWRQESIVGSVFETLYQPHPDGGVLPTITGRAFVNGDLAVLLDPDDPFALGMDASSQA